MCQKCALLKLEKARLQYKIRRLEAKIEGTIIYCDQQQKVSGAVLAQKSGVPRARWSWHKAAGQVSGIVLRTLGG